MRECGGVLEYVVCNPITQGVLFVSLGNSVEYEAFIRHSRYDICIKCALVRKRALHREIYVPA